MTSSPVNPDPVASVATGPGLRPAPGTVDFAELLTMLGHDDLTAVCHQPVGGKFSFMVTESADAASLATVADADMWFGINPVSRPAPGSRGKSDDVTRLSCLWVDFDVKPGACTSLTQAQAIIDDLAAALGTPPAVLIWSGHGVQPLWIIEDDDAVFASNEDRARAATLIKRWRRMVENFSEKRDAGVVDAVFDLARILRIPGTTNYKETPVPVVATRGAGGPLTLNEIDEVLDAYGIPLPEDEITCEAVDPSSYEWADKACWYAPAMITGWETDGPRAGRHQWLLSQATRLAAARRYGCLTAEEHRRGVETLQKRMGELCAQGMPRAVLSNEIPDALTWGEQKVAQMTDERVASELGGHTHTDHVEELATMPPADSPAATTTSTTEVHRGQVRMAYRLAAAYTGRLLHVTGIGWHRWDGQRWAYDDTGAASRAVLDILERAWREARDDKDLAADVRKCESHAGITGVLAIAGTLTDFCATVRDLDADPYLLNTASGTFDLRTGALRPHNPSDRITKVTRAAVPDSIEAGSAWQAFLERVVPDTEVREYLQRVAGVALLGRVTEHILAILTGTGANGKGTFYKALCWALGDYASTAEPDLFMHRQGAHPTGEMDLLGRRLIVVSESEKDRRLAEATMKRLTGGDTIRARRMRQDFIEFEPSHTPLLITNHLPKVSGDDPAIWRRLRVIPFAVEIPPAEREKSLDERLQIDADAVLAWAVAGWRDYQHRGDLAEPAAVVVATDEYHKASDAISRFVDECCVTSTPALKATTSQLFKAWEQWRTEDGAEAVSQKAFGQALDKHGYPVTDKTRIGRFRAGIGLKVEVSDDAA